MASESKDCLQCRAIGSMTFGGISLYALYLRINTPSRDRGHRVFLACFAIGAASVSVLRAVY
eukprot:gene4159-8267_t